MYGDSYNNSANDFAGTQMGMSNNQFNNQTGTGVPDSKPEKTLPPLTIKSLLSAPEPMPGSNLQINGQEVNQLTIAGQITSLNVQSAYITYKINDGTAEIDCKVWINDDSNQGPTFNETQYVKVFGRLNVYQGTRSVNVFRVLAIEDMNELTLHNLEIVYAHLANLYRQKHAAPEMQTNSGMGAMGGMNMNMSSTMGGGIGGMSNDMNMDFADGAENELQVKILKLIRLHDQGDQGCNVSSVFNAMPGTGVDEIRVAIDKMADLGLLYSTVDDEHYKCTSTGN